MNGGPKTLGEKWDELYQSLQMPPYDAVFGGMKKSAMKTQLEKMVNNCSSEGTQAQRESGGGTDGTEEESDETEEERKVAADLVSELGALEVLGSRLGQYFEVHCFCASATRAVSNTASSIFF